LKGAIEVLVIDRVFVMPDPRRRIGNFAGYQSNAVGSGSRLDLGNSRAGPRFDGRGLPDRGKTGPRKGERTG
jgi:hypothetical protein